MTRVKKDLCPQSAMWDSWDSMIYISQDIAREPVKQMRWTLGSWWNEGK